MEKALSWAYSMVGNYEDAKDLSQEAFVKSHKALKSFALKSAFSTWFYRILVNTVKDYFRSKKWQRFLKWESSESMDNFFQTVQASGAGADRSVLQNELAVQMTKAITALPLKQRTIFTLRFIENHSIKEISEITANSEGTVKATIHFAIQKVKQSLAPYVSHREVSYGL
ncbi:MAG: hypothetical protein COV74_10325 [Candidatus Omnitrophica bacterium CG11_big_fil_rev_8_21_14_0_20_45_26]|uniref:RNA polymerase subunit sigma-24 n=1 Tax=Candidatus Abzuiibacterium crystallinum TaxID=1974748 RepID=A0A2H0LKN8_9BACT|nr:MAG: hypothetical protein COV74_10325 [Candidatus Omnitrophica bacterium CG11_big_fil_rev_8_21_14_0_20_45_26]PIW63935.1 MAG: hypothetical protein COW12_08495 [Candidatus Omnitrophica bacterium CG12_big_fil_rev_8_21_14_0_65_45_16]